MLNLHVKLIIIFLVLIFIKLITTQHFHPSNLELRPDFMIINSSNSTVDFLCINHRSDDIPFIIHISKNISKNSLKISRHHINRTFLHIRLRFRNYIGLFHLYCYLKDQKDHGIRADIIVKTDIGSIRLIDRCRVYDNQYLKCSFHAPIISQAIQNDFPVDFQFTEINHSSVYSSRYIFLKNESFNECLVFQWYPNIDKYFPNDIQMNMYIRIPHFNSIVYRFNLTPIFMIKPKFKLNIISLSKIQVQFPSTIFCEKRNNSNWTRIQSNTIITDLEINRIHEICLRCRKELTDPSGDQYCQQINLSWKIGYYLELNKKFLLVLGLVSFDFILFIIICFMYFSKRKTVPIQNQINIQSADNDEPFMDDEDPVVQDPDDRYQYMFESMNTSKVFL